MNNKTDILVINCRHGTTAGIAEMRDNMLALTCECYKPSMWGGQKVMYVEDE